MGDESLRAFHKHEAEKNSPGGGRVEIRTNFKRSPQLGGVEMQNLGKWSPSDVIESNSRYSSTRVELNVCCIVRGKTSSQILVEPVSLQFRQVYRTAPSAFSSESAFHDREAKVGPQQ